MTKDIQRRLNRLEQAAGPTRSLARVYFEPRPCADPAAFARQCDAEAAAIGSQTAIVVRFVKPGEVPPAGPLQ